MALVTLGSECADAVKTAVDADDRGLSHHEGSSFQSCEIQKHTPFDQHSVPAGLLKAHQTKAGTWAKIVIVSGKLSYRILEPECEEWVLSSENHGVVEPTILHEVAPLGEVQFYLDFYRTADA